MERRDFMALTATAAVITPTLADAKGVSLPDYRKIFGLKEEDNLLGVALCHKGDALTEEDQALLNDTPRWGRLEGPSKLAERVSKIATLAGVEDMSGVYLCTGILIEVDRALESLFEEWALRADASVFDSWISGHSILNKEHTAGIASFSSLGQGTIFIPEYHQALVLKKKFRGMALWTRTGQPQAYPGLAQS